MQFNNPPRKIKNNMTTPHLKKSLGRSSSRLALLLIALVFACLGIRQSAQAAQAPGYTVTLRQVGPNVVATGSGAINLNGLTFSLHGGFTPEILPGAALQFGGGIITGSTSSSVDLYFQPRGPTSFGSGGATSASSGSGDMVGIFPIHLIFERALIVPRGYVSGTFLSNSAIYSGKTIATLGVTPGTYVWTWGTGANQNFTLQIPVPPPPPVTGPPVAITNPATLFTSFSATLNGSVDPNGLTTSVYFQYGTTTGYGFTTAPHTKTGNTPQSVSANISGLTASTTYHFRIVATNSAGTWYGRDRIFTTLSATGFPVVTSNPATSIASHSARLNGTVNPHGLSTTVYFQYGRTTSYGNRTPNQTKTGNNYQNVFANISGLSAHTTYHFRIVATNSVGTRYGRDRTFTAQ